ncbi:hypothetical protein FKM82_024039 [Ascaphus truei]
MLHHNSTKKILEWGPFSKSAGHPGTRRNSDLIKRTFWWPNIQYSRMSMNSLGPAPCVPEINHHATNLQVFSVPCLYQIDHGHNFQWTLLSSPCLLWDEHYPCYC